MVLLRNSFLNWFVVTLRAGPLKDIEYGQRVILVIDEMTNTRMELSLNETIGCARGTGGQ